MIVLLVLVGVPSFSGIDRLPLIKREVRVTARGYVPDGGWPARIGALAPVGGLALAANDPAFGGFSALAVQGGAATLLSDGGNLVRLSIRQGRVESRGGVSLRLGPGTGWAKESRDTESLVLDAARGQAWIGFERANAIWRYELPGWRASGWRAPGAMRRWPMNGGAEVMVRLGDRFIVIAEQTRGRARGGGRPGLIFTGDPTDAKTPVSRFRFLPPRGYSPSDAAALPGGDLLILVRRWRDLHFSAKLVRVARGDIRPGASVRGREIATLAPPVLRENAEGLAITREGGATMVWIVTDNDGWWIRPTLLLKFRLVDQR